LEQTIKLIITSFLKRLRLSWTLIPLNLTANLRATPAIVGIIEGIAESLASLLKTYSGYLSDKVTRRKPLALTGYGSMSSVMLIPPFRGGCDHDKSPPVITSIHPPVSA
jgi:hypothetical protein